jgi:hypothetical protein
MNKLNIPTLIVTVAILGTVATLHLLHHPVPAILSSLVGVVVTSLLPALVKSSLAPTSPSSATETPTSQASKPAV